MAFQWQPRENIFIHTNSLLDITCSRFDLFEGLGWEAPYGAASARRSNCVSRIAFTPLLRQERKMGNDFEFCTIIFILDMEWSVTVCINDFMILMNLSDHFSHFL